MIKSKTSGKTNISVVNCDDRHDGKHDDDSNQSNVFGIPPHNNAFAHLKVHGGFQDQHGKYDVSVDANNTDLCRKVLSNGVHGICKQRCSGIHTSKEHVNMVNTIPKTLVTPIYLVKPSIKSKG